MRNFNDSNEKIKLISELQQNCGLVENAIDHLMKCKKHVDENAVEVKFQINGNATSALDALRKREVQLLRQVDVTQAQHLDHLQAHYAKLHQLLGNLRQSLHCAEAGKLDGPQNISQEDLDLARAVQQQKLIPNSISYVDDARQLIARIESFGKISAYYNFLSSQHKQDLVSRCLPSNQEEYGDIEHQLLYKTLEEIKWKKDDSKVSDESNESSGSTDGWLRNYSAPPNSSTCNSKFAWVLPEYLLVKEPSFWLSVSSQSAEIANPTSGKVRHIQDWLRQLKQQDTFDNVDYKTNLANKLYGNIKEAIPSTETLSESIEMISVCDTSDATGFTMLNAAPCGGGGNINGNHHHQMTWLRTVANNKEQSRNNGCHCNGQENNVDIEDIVACNNVDNMWLAKNNANHCKKNVAATLLASNHNLSAAFTAASISESSFELADICCANETCRTALDCVCQERCAQRALQKRLGSLPDSANSFSRQQDIEWIRRALSETILVDENPKWLSCNYGGDEDEKVELSEKNLRRTDVKNCGDAGVLGGANYSTTNCHSNTSSSDDWLSGSSAPAHAQKTGGCPDFVRDDFKVYFQQGVWTSNWLSYSQQLVIPMDCNEDIRDDFKMYFQKDSSDLWVQK